MGRGLPVAEEMERALEREAEPVTEMAPPRSGPKNQPGVRLVRVARLLCPADLADPAGQVLVVAAAWAASAGQVREETVSGPVVREVVAG